MRNRIVFKIETGYKLELLSEETILLLGISKRDIDQNKSSDTINKHLQYYLLLCQINNLVS